MCDSLSIVEQYKGNATHVSVVDSRGTLDPSPKERLILDWLWVFLYVLDEADQRTIATVARDTWERIRDSCHQAHICAAFLAVPARSLP